MSPPAATELQLPSFLVDEWQAVRGAPPALIREANSPTAGAQLEQQQQQQEGRAGAASGATTAEMGAATACATGVAALTATEVAAAAAVMAAAAAQSGLEPEGGHWLVAGRTRSDAAERRSMAELRAMAERGELAWGVSLERSEDGLLLPLQKVRWGVRGPASWPWQCIKL